MIEPCNDCNGTGEGAIGMPGGDGLECSTCEGTGNVDVEDKVLETFTMTVTRSEGTTIVSNVVAFEPMANHYQIICADEERVIVPYSGDIYSISVTTDVR